MISFNEPIFLKNQKTLKEISLDDSRKVSMTKSKKDAVNFDLVKSDYLSNNGYSNDKLKSCDALYSHSAGHLLIEFKNGQIGGQIKKDIRIKISDSLLIIGDIKNINIIPVSKTEMEFVLVYNECVNSNKLTKSQGEIHNHLISLSNSEYIYFDLERYKGTFFKDVHTYTASEFDNYIAKL